MPAKKTLILFKEIFLFQALEELMNWGLELDRNLLQVCFLFKIFV